MTGRHSVNAKVASNPPRELPRRRGLPTWIVRLGRWCRIALLRVAQFLLIAWGALAIYYSNLPWARTRVALAASFAALGVWAFWVNRRAKLRWTFVASFAAVAAWWVLIPPRSDRAWRQDVAVLPRAVIDVDRVILTGFRNF